MLSEKNGQVNMCYGSGRNIEALCLELTKNKMIARGAFFCLGKEEDS